MAHIPEYKIILLGAHIKGAIGQAFLGRENVGFQKEVQMPDKRRVLLDVLDPSGMESFQAMMNVFLLTADGIMLVYDSQERHTFSSMEDTCRNVYKEKGDRYPIVLVGHYSDDSYVAIEEGKQLAKGLGCPFFMVSVATGENIAEAFYELIRIIAQSSDPEVLVRPDDCSGLLHLCRQVIEKRGPIRQSIANIIFVGPPGAGKTTTKMRILNLVPARIRGLVPSTGVVEVPLKVTITKLPRSSAAIASGVQWTLLTLDDQVLRLVEMLMIAAENLHLQPQQKSKSKVAAAMGQLFRKQPAIQGAKSESGRQEAAAQGRQIDYHSSKYLKKPEHILEESLNRHWGILHRSLEGSTTVHLTDTGGQPEFHEILPALISGPVITLLVFNVSENLREKCPVRYISADGRMMEEYDTSYTTEDVIFQSLAATACYGSQVSSPNSSSSSQSVALFVGTHKDKASRDDITTANKVLREKIENTKHFDSNMIQYPNPGQVVLPIDNTQENGMDIRHLRTVLSDIIERKFPPVEIPAPQLLFETSLRKSGVRILEMKHCRKVAKRCGIRKEELKDTLLYLHRSGMIRYYPEVKEMKELVICDQQLIVDSINNLIARTFTFQKVGEAGCRRFKKTGMFSVEEFQEIHKRSATLKETSDLLPAEKLLKLLEYLHILVPIAALAGLQQNYFMPCILPTDELECPTASDLQAHCPPLLVTFECGYCPVGIFSALAVYLISQSNDPCCTLKWSLMERVDVYRNKIRFLVGQDVDKVTMVAHPTHFEVWFYRPEGHQRLPTYEACSSIRTAILEGLNTVIKSRSYSCKTTPHLAFNCPGEDCPTSPHIAICEGDNPTMMRCKASGPVSMLAPHFVWFGQEVSDRGPGVPVQPLAVPSTHHQITTLTIDDSPLGIEALVTVRLETAAVTEWFDLGLALGLHYDTLKQMEIENRGIIGECAREMLVAWLKRRDYVTKNGLPSWQVLGKALTHPNVNRAELTERIAKKHPKH